jgi:hypothetical protein
MLRFALPLLWPVFLVACIADQERPRNLTPMPTLDFIDGPARSDETALRAWLKEHDGSTYQLRLPVDLESTGVGVRNFSVGVVAIDVGDSALGVALHDHVRSLCRDAARCSLWLEGYWAQNRLDLRKVGDRVVESDPRAGREADRRSGQALDAKGGAVLRTDAGETIYVQGLPAWPGSVLGKRVEVLGVIVSRKLIPDPIVDETGAISPGAPSAQKVFESARWSALD